MIVLLVSGGCVAAIVVVVSAISSVHFVLAKSARERQRWMLMSAIVTFPLAAAWLAIFVGVLVALYPAAMGLALIVGLANALRTGRTRDSD